MLSQLRTKHTLQIVRGTFAFHPFQKEILGSASFCSGYLWSWRSNDLSLFRMVCPARSEKQSSSHQLPPPLYVCDDDSLRALVLALVPCFKQNGKHVTLNAIRFYPLSILIVYRLRLVSKAWSRSLSLGCLDGVNNVLVSHIRYDKCRVGSFIVSRCSDELTSLRRLQSLLNITLLFIEKKK